MCYNVKATAKANKLAERYGVHQDIDNAIHAVQEKLSGFDHPELAVVIQGSLTHMRWGLIPAWVKTREDALEIQNHTLNARSETAFGKPSFRDAILSRRCVVPVDAFYEWQHHGKDKIPYQIIPSREPYLSLAGIWETWKSPHSHTPVNSFSILTCTANPLMAQIHNSNLRMPVILSYETVSEWIAPELPVSRIQELAVPCPDEWILAERIEQFQ
jgi:putative SOS response-associated peptidase YedK